MFTLEVKPNEDHTAVGMIRCDEYSAETIAEIAAVAITTTLSFADSILDCDGDEKASKKILEKAVSNYLNSSKLKSGTFLAPKDSDDFWDRIEPLE